MQEQEKETLRTEIYNQVMKDLNEQKKPIAINQQNSHSRFEQKKQKTFSVLRVVLASIWVVIVAPIIVNSIEVRKWPLTIQLPSFTPEQGNDPAIQIFTLIIIVVVGWTILTIFSPFQCRCGFRTWSPFRMKKHLEMRHTMKK
jgi:hypothetical protein